MLDDSRNRKTTIDLKSKSYLIITFGRVSVVVVVSPLGLVNGVGKGGRLLADFFASSCCCR